MLQLEDHFNPLHLSLKMERLFKDGLLSLKERDPSPQFCIPMVARRPSCHLFLLLERNAGLIMGLLFSVLTITAPSHSGKPLRSQFGATSVILKFRIWPPHISGWWIIILLCL